MKYQVVTATEKYVTDAASRVEKVVNELLAKGWKLQGGVSVSRSEIGYSTWYILAQAMVKEDCE